MILALLLSTSLCAAAGPGSAANLTAGSPFPHSLAFVNDPRSHGQVGDGLLSLNEAIQLHNRVLTFAQLSPAEQTRLSGFGQDISWIDINAINTPQITMERDLDVILDFPHGLLVSGTAGKPILDFAPVANGFVSVSNYVNFRNLELRNGPVAISLTQTDSPPGTVIDNVDFIGQTVAAIDVSMTSPNENGRVLIDSCTFTNAPVGIAIDESPAGRSTFFYIGNTAMSGVQAGVHARLGPGGGATYILERVIVDAVGTGIRFERPGAGDDRALALDGTYVEVTGASGMDIDASATAATALTLRMLDLLANGPAGKCLRVGPLGSDVEGVIEDLRLAGDIEILGGGPNPLTLANAVLRTSSAQIGASAGVLAVVDSLLDGVNLTTSGAVPVSVSASCLQGGTVQGSASAPLVLDGCYLGATASGNVSQTNALTAPQRGTFDLLPRVPVVGGTLMLQADLPPGLVGLWAIGSTALFPQILPRPLHIYIVQHTAATVPGIYRLQQGISIAVPALPVLIGSDWVCQMAVFPDPGVAAPALALPPGRRFVLR